MMTYWLIVNIVWFFIIVIFGWFGSHAVAEAGHVNSLIWLGMVGGWLVWVIIGSLYFLLRSF